MGKALFYAFFPWASTLICKQVGEEVMAQRVIAPYIAGVWGWDVNLAAA